MSDVAGFDETYQRLIRLISIRERSSRELHDRLIKENYPAGHVSEALERARYYNIVNDLRFAEALTRTRIHAGKGLAGIVHELSEHDIDVSEIAGWPHVWLYDEEYDEEKAAYQTLEHRPPRSKNLREGAYRRLIQKGISSAIASTVSRQWMEAHAR